MDDWKDEIQKRLAELRLAPTREADVADELSAHLQDRYAELVSAGATEAEARRAVLAELSFTDFAQQLPASLLKTPSAPIAEGAAHSGSVLRDFARDLRFGARMLRKTPGFTAIATLTLALGIGANTAVFTILNTLLFSPVPVVDASRLAAINTAPSGKTASESNLEPVSFLNLEDYRGKNRVFSNVAGYSEVLSLTMQHGVETQRLFGQLITQNYFETLGLKPALGRFFTPEEDAIPGAHPVAVIGYSAWQARFGGVQDILGKTIKLNNHPFEIIGVAQKGFKGVTAIFGPDLWVPSMMAAALLPPPQEKALEDRSIRSFTGVGRLRPGVSLSRAQADMKTIAAALANEYPDANEGQTVALRPLAEAALGTQGPGLKIGSVMLMAVVGLVLLLACSNVANLLLARASARRQEIAVRMALGAGRRRLLRQLLTESVLLSLLGGVLGFFAGYAGCQLLWSFKPAEYSANLAELRLNGSVFLFSLIISILTGLIFGILPALRTSRTPVAETLKENSRTAGRSLRQIGLANVLLGGQVALSLVLLVVSALFLRSVEFQYTIDPGFQTKHLAVFLLYPGQQGYDHARTEQFYKEVRERFATVPGVASASWASELPFWAQAQSGVVIEGQEQRKKSEQISTVVNTIDLGFFQTMNIPLLEGRSFTDDDREETDPAVIVNDTMAQRYWPKQSALGKRIQLPGEKSFRRIVGVVKTVDYASLGETPQSCAYVPLSQKYMDSMVLYVKTDGDPGQMFSTLQSELRNIDPALPIDDVRTGSKLIDQALWGAKMGVTLLGVFGILALALAAVGLYGLMAYSVNQRRREIGIRMAMGAGQARVVALILREGMTLATGGALLGLALSVALGHAISKFLYGVSGSDPASLGGASLVLLLVAAVACYLPARNASRVDPLVALRES
ncbi:MAG TPA: ABC transporter permease [Candidatus Methylomirabilis sp.]|nr:ABC transporter permease [Candidatus Methylomirabilis sp.]